MIKYHHRPFKLREIKIEVTHRCLLECIHCSSEAKYSCTKKLQEDDCLRIINEAIDMGVEKVSFSGGEPLIWWPYLENAVEVAHNGGLRVIIYTSGNAPEISHKMYRLKALGVEACIFSIFGGSRNVHEHITHNSGSFNKTLEAIACANKAGLQTELHFVPLAYNYKELKAVSKLAMDYGISRISVLRFVPQGRGRFLKKTLLNKQQNIRLKKIIQGLRSSGINIRTGSPYNFLMLNNQPECCAGIDRLTIGPDLKVVPCDAFKQIKAEDIVGTFRFSSLNNCSLSECWEDSPYLEIVREFLTTPFATECTSCKKLEKCLSGCPAQKFIANGKLEKMPDPMCLLN